MRGRWYDPQVGRFIQEDPIHAGVNDYIFAGNDPINGSDPSGLDHSAYRQTDCSSDTQEELTIDLNRDLVISACVGGTGGIVVTGFGGSSGGPRGGSAYPDGLDLPFPGGPGFVPAGVGGGTSGFSSQAPQSASKPEDHGIPIKWHDRKCQAALTDLAISGLESALVIAAAGPELVAADGLLVLGGVLARHMAKDAARNVLDPTVGGTGAARFAVSAGYTGTKPTIGAYLIGVTPIVNAGKAAYDSYKECF
jgi:hypothetical protein